MQNNPLVSVITPTFNRAHTLQRAIKSVLGQTYDNWELIIVDDGSTDVTKELVRAVKDDRVKYVYKPNGGPGQARNYGITHAKGTWVMYLDSDDVLLPECIKTMVEWAAQHRQAVFAFPRAIRIFELHEQGKPVKSFDESDNTPAHFTIQGIFERGMGFQPNGMMHLRRLYDEGIRWDEELALMEDWEFLLTIGANYPQGFLYVPVVLQRYTARFGSDNLVSQADYAAWADAFEYIYQKHQHDVTLRHQTWYPAKVVKWRQRQKEFEAGQRPTYQLHYFQ